MPDLTNNRYVERNETMMWAYVGVESYTDAHGQSEPRAIIWKDGTRYEIDQVLDRRAAYPNASGSPHGWWYLIRIGGAYRELWYENSLWHVLVQPGRGGVQPHTPPQA